MRRKQSLCGDGVQGAVAITGRAKNVFGGKSVAPLHVALICIVWAGRTLQFALKAFYCASAPYCGMPTLPPAYAQPVCTVVRPGGGARPLRMYIRKATLFVQCACAG